MKEGIKMKQRQSPRDKTRSSSKSEIADKRRASSFTSSSSPWFRRNSLLSTAMIQSENISVYDSPNYYDDCSSYNVISLKECQGFIFNQDLFASPYQQLRSMANERKLKALSFSHNQRSSSSSRSNSSSNLNSNLKLSNLPRRHTSYHEVKPKFSSSILNNSSIMDDGDDNDNDNDNDNNNYNNNDNHNDNDSNMRVDSLNPSVQNAMDLFDNTTVDIAVMSDGEGDDDSVEEYDEYEHSHMDQSHENDALYKVHVTEIVVHDSDDSILPK